MADFYDAGALRRLATNLFHGWGYNFYRAENQLRADDLLIRARICDLLGAARTTVTAAETAYRRDHLPPPTRANPRPAPTALADAQTLESLSTELGALEGAIRALPTPESDRMTQRFRQEAATLARLAECDEAMVGHAEYLRSLLSTLTAPTMLGAAGEIRACLAAIHSLIAARAALLTD